MAKNILFVCVENSCRSQIAEGFARVLGKGILEPYSAGSRPAGKVNPEAIVVMREIGIDLTSQSSKGFAGLSDVQFDCVITMGCGDQCPAIPARERRDWQIPDPKGKGIEYFRQVREEIRNRVLQLLQEMSIKVGN